MKVDTDVANVLKETMDNCFKQYLQVNVKCKAKASTQNKLKNMLDRIQQKSRQIIHNVEQE